MRRSSSSASPAPNSSSSDRTGSANSANASSLRLEPLSDANCEALIGNLGRGLAQETTARVLETAEGNPLFIEQLVAMLAEEDHADRSARSRRRSMRCCRHAWTGSGPASGR